MPRCACSCGARYRVPLGSLGKTSRCKKCGSVFTLAEADETLTVAPLVESEEEAPQVAVQGQIFSPSGAPALLSTEDVFTASVPADLLKRQYSSDVIWAFLFPTALGDILMFLGIWLVFFFASLAVAPIRFLWAIFWFLLFGWYAAYRFDILESAAAGEEELPSPLATRNLAGDLVAPILGWIGSWMVVMVPAALYVAYLLDRGMLDALGVTQMVSGGLRGVLGGSTADLPALTVLVAAGIVAWPMVVLCIAVGGFATLYRPDLIMATVLKTMPGYVTTILLIVLTLVAEALIQPVGPAWARPRITPPGAAIPPPFSFKLLVLSLGLHVYLDIVRMKLIGLYYFHNKEKFAWSWE